MRSLCFAAVSTVMLCLPSATFAGDADAEEQAAIDAAVEHVASSVVQIQTVGGRERVEGVLFGAGPTTGLVVDPDGYIISSAFNFVNKPSSILVRLPGGDRRPAKLVATDHARMLVLLKIDAPKPLPVCDIVPRAEMRVGQWTIAVGRAFDSPRPNVAVGILSAVHHIWGKAIQTDAAVSPNNYGGPLVDIRGRVFGVLAPLSPDAAGEIAGVEWYDSGIGFAVPMEHIQQVLPRLKKGEDLRPGLAGVSLKTPNPFTSPAIVTAALAKSPAAAAGIKPGDEIVDVDGRAIRRAAELREELGRRYAGDAVHLTVLRNKKRIVCELQLAEKIVPFQHGFLGILPMRSGENDEKGVAVRYVYPNSPAETAGIVAGDVIVSLSGAAVRDRTALAEQIGNVEPGGKIEIEVRRGDDVQKHTIALASLPEDLPPKQLPAASNGDGEAFPESAHAGGARLQIPEFPNEIWVYVPSGHAAEEPRGVVVWLHGPRGYDWRAILGAWKSHCDQDNLILTAPKAAGADWTPDEAALVDHLLTEICGKYAVDPARVTVHGYESGGNLAFLAAFRNREAIRAVAAVEALPTSPPPENEPSHRLAIYLALAGKSKLQPMSEPVQATLRKLKIPVVSKKLGDATRYLNAKELSELARWIDTLDRI
jgi:serine protease Do